MKKWAEMTPRERDALIHEVFGYKIVHVPFIPSKVDLNESFFTDEAYSVWVRTFPNGMAPKLVPHYTTNIGDAWKVVEKLKEKGFYTRLQHCILDETVEYWCCFVNDQRDGYSDSTAPTAPEAICLAALRAVGVNVK